MTRRSDLPRFANLRTGDMVRGRRRKRRPGRWLMPVSVIALTLGTFAGLALGDVPERYEAPRGYDVCQTAKC